MGMYIAAVPFLAGRELKPFFQVNINSVSFGIDINSAVEKAVDETFYNFKPYRFLFRKSYLESFFHIGKPPVIVKHNISPAFGNRKINAVVFGGIINRIFSGYPDPCCSRLTVFIKYPDINIFLHIFWQGKSGRNMQLDKNQAG